jgi:two-component system, LuxR family, secretion system response regulator SsrB
MCQPTSNRMERPGGKLVRLRLLIADDQPRVRQSLEALLTALGWSIPNPTAYPIDIVGEADDGQQLVEQVQALHPDVVVLDLPTHGSAQRIFVSGSKWDGLAAIRTIKSRWPGVRIVVLTMYATDRAAVLLAGADAFLLKGCPPSELLDAVMPRPDNRLGKEAGVT